MKDEKQLNVKVDSEIFVAISILAAKYKKPKKEIIEKALVEFLKKEGELDGEFI